MNTSEHGRMIRVNRAPVLTLWATVMAERLGFDHDEALTLGRAVAGTSAQMKGRALGIYEPSEEPPSRWLRSAGNALSPMRPLVCASSAGQCLQSARRTASGPWRRISSRMFRLL